MPIYRKYILLIFAILISLTSCDREDEVFNMTIASITTMNGEYHCYIVKYENDTLWSLFYDSIKGFKYQPGHEYIINVTKSPVKTTLQDASSVHYKLNCIISDTKKESEGIPSSFFEF